MTPHGQLVPQGGGDTIPLSRARLVFGRRESCDIMLPFPNVSGEHCELRFDNGWWILEDLKSTNGVKVNGTRTQKKVLQPGDTITIAKRSYTIEFTASRNPRPVLPDAPEAEIEDIMGMPLLEKAGLVHPPKAKKPKE